jgi:succinoglycan biosynthesis transport protein ExoP
MSVDQFLRTIWRRKWTVILTVVIATACTYVAARSAPKVYESSATLFVGDDKAGLDDFQSLQSAQSLTKTYAELIKSPAIADQVDTALGGPGDGTKLLESMTFKPVSETQLLVVTAEGPSGRRAAETANRYSSIFIDYAKTQLVSNTKSTISLVDAARPAGAPIRPRPLLYAGTMLIISIFLGAGLAVVRDQLSRRVDDDEELRRSLGAPVLGRVPIVSSRKLDASREDQFLEAFRVLRVNLAYAAPGRRIRSLLVTSAEPGEGKTTASIALARVLAESGQRVLLVEADLRRPNLSQSLDLAADRRGLLQFLAHGLRLDEVTHATRIPNVSVVPAGATLPAPSALLQPERLQQLVDAGMEWADFVIVDSPPVSAGADASILAGAAEDVLFVINARRTRRVKMEAALRQLRQASATVVGLLVNGEQRAGAAYGPYGYGDQPRKGRNRLAEEIATPVER